MRVTPALPWDSDTAGGTVKLQTPVSKEQLLAGYLAFTIHTTGSGGGDRLAAVVEYQNHLYLEEEGGGAFLYQIADFSQSTDELTLTAHQNKPEGCYLVSVDTVEPGIVGTVPALPSIQENVTVNFARGMTIGEAAEHIKIEVEGLWTDGEQVDATHVRWGYQYGSEHIYITAVWSAAGALALSMQLNNTIGDEIQTVRYN